MGLSCCVCFVVLVCCLDFVNFWDLLCYGGLLVLVVCCGVVIVLMLDDDVGCYDCCCLSVLDELLVAL